METKSYQFQKKKSIVTFTQFKRFTLDNWLRLLEAQSLAVGHAAF
jgi:aryl carrier-like protein